MSGNRRAIATALAMVVIVIAVCCIGLVGPAAAQGQETDSGKTDQSETGGFGTQIRQWLPAIGSGATALAVVIGGVLAWRNAQIFRAKAPHIVIRHEISHRPLGTQYVHIFVTAILHNSSRVHVEFFDGFVRIQQVRPTSNEDVELLYSQVFQEQEYSNFQWTDLDSLRHRWDKDALLVEPGETETETFDFVAQRGVASVALSTYFYNSRVVGKIPDDMESAEVQRRRRRYRCWLRERGPMGWGRTTVYDIMPPEQDTVTMVR